MPYLSKVDLDNLLKHKYSGIDDSILYNFVLRHYYDVCIKYVPLWIAPNMITFIGTIVALSSSLLVSYYSPDLTMSAPAPLILCLIAAFSLFFYQTFDNLDGRQARRTKTSSPLGEMFDHGCDSLVVTVMAVTTGSIASYGVSWLLVSLLIFSWGLFWASTWEQFHTGTLYLGKINGPNEGIISIVFMYLLTYIYGYDLWTQTNAFGYSLNFLVTSFAICTMVVTIIYTLFTVTTHALKEDALQKVFSHWVPFLIFSSCVLSWFFLDPVLFHKYPHTVTYTLGLCFGEMVSRLIVAHVCLAQYAMVQRPMVPLMLFMVPLFLKFQVEMCFWVYVIATVISYGHFVSGVSLEISSFLKIRIFSIPNTPGSAV